MAHILQITICNPFHEWKYFAFEKKNPLKCVTPVGIIDHRLALVQCRQHTCAYFCYKMVHGGIWGWCIVGFLWSITIKQLFCTQVSIYNHVAGDIWWWSIVYSYYTSRTTKLLGGYTGFTPSVRPSVHPSVPHPVSALQRLQFWLDPFHIYISYQATSEDVSHVKFLAKFQNLYFWQILKICNFDIVLFSLGIWCESLIWVNTGWKHYHLAIAGDNHGAAGVTQNAGVLVVLVTLSFHKRFKLPWSLNKMADTLQTTIWNAFCPKKCRYFY